MKNKKKADIKGFYEFTQNNSGGSFTTDKNLCHRLFIEAESEGEAISKAEDLGCYWNGCESGSDCDCCGDRWSISTYFVPESIEFDVCVYSRDEKQEKQAEEEWNIKYGKYPLAKAPQWEKTAKRYSSRRYYGKILITSIEEYAQFMANEYGWTSPDARIFFLDGKVVEIFKK